MNETSWQLQAQRGVELLQDNQPHAALKLLVEAARSAPDDLQLRYWIANCYRMTGNVQRSEQIFKELLEKKAAYFDTAFAYAFLLRDTGRVREMAEVLKSAAEQPGLNLEQLLQIAGFLRDSHQLGAAISVCRKAMELSPRRADLHYRLARLHEANGDIDSALEHLMRTMELKPSIGPAWTALANLKRFESADDRQFKWLEENIEYQHGHEANTCKAFAYGKALDDLERWPQAWEQYVRGNELLSLTRLWNRDAWNRILHRSADLAESMPPPDSETGSRAVFIVGMPCSGGSVLEQLLDRQPGVYGRGELGFLDQYMKQSNAAERRVLPHAEKERLASDFWKQLRLGGPDEAYYVSNNPLNFRYLDILFRIMPSAKVILMNRDGRDAALSCFFQPFEHNDAAFSNKLDDLVRFYRGYRQLMYRWQQAFGDRILQVDYDALVQSGDEVIGNVMQFIGAPCDIDRQHENGGPNSDLDRTVGRWRHYFEMTPEFFDRLKAIDAKY